ncbi:hypothetical protein [Xenorhabdus bovienii]|uniref:hypothetical protein n=1 Tax=Xenorhabdus bovienii TaxID=40576 RepID=UPI0004D9EE38|nr:hypothetical protein [Xenorhabdus bovienii]CDG90619.1 hypothetical protein XBFFR1_970031 [Xenorhabdus bovienii str. feltiae France]CDG90686.1 hypothetical protein XBFFL1_1040018 [Xenorhabdus bovienii str. feltiae Florida]
MGDRVPLMLPVSRLLKSKGQKKADISPEASRFGSREGMDFFKKQVFAVIPTDVMVIHQV